MKNSTIKPSSEAGIKHDQQKPRIDLLDRHAIEQLAAVLTFGAKKYAATIGAMALNIAHAMCNCMFLLGLSNKPELDDRYDAK